MKLTLEISKRFVNSLSGPREQFVFSVLDLDRVDGYPANFVCLLPKTIENVGKSKSKFVEKFGEESNQIAIRLLKEALGSESDVTFKDEIEKRLDILEPKQVTVKCVVCGCDFEPKRRGRYIQRMCKVCKSKRYGSK
jgi:hypothetical protein